MYDLDNDDKISKDELLAILHMMVGANISEEQLTSIAERTILEADQNGDQMISFEEFCNALERTDVEQKMSIRFLNWDVYMFINEVLLRRVISFRMSYEDTIKWLHISLLGWEVLEYHFKCHIALYVLYFWLCSVA